MVAEVDDSLIWVANRLDKQENRTSYWCRPWLRDGRWEEVDDGCLSELLIGPVPCLCLLRFPHPPLFFSLPFSLPTLFLPSSVSNSQHCYLNTVFLLVFVSHLRDCQLDSGLSEVLGWYQSICPSTKREETLIALEITHCLSNPLSFLSSLLYQ